jgi:hypothetical protein
MLELTCPKWWRGIFTIISMGFFKIKISSQRNHVLMLITTLGTKT